MKNLQIYNTKIGLRINRALRVFLNIANRIRLKNRDFSLICNNCNGGVIMHDLGLEFKSPTINMFFYGDHFLKFCENFEFYISQQLTYCERPIHQPEIDYPVCNLGDLELHFLHYSTFEEAKEKWERRSARLNRDNMYIMWTFFSGTDSETLARFERLPFLNKVAFTEKEFLEYMSAFCIKGYSEGLGVLTEFVGWFGKRKIDQFDYVQWFNEGKRGQ